MSAKMDEDTPMDEVATAVAPEEFVPPSINETALLAGDTYSYYSPVPALLLAPETRETENEKENKPETMTTTTTTIPATKPHRPACVLGVDEAGRGPVLGPMVYGVFYAPLDASDALLRGQTPGSAHRFDDSKVLSATTRSTLLQAVCTPSSPLHTNCGWAIAALSARDIAAGMMAPTGAGAGGGNNLNGQAAEATVGLIRGVLERGVRVTDVFVDTVGPPATYQKKLERFFPGIRITVAKKADSLYPSVSAASVCAKVTRDVALEVLYRRYVASNETNETWGSGYPSDARCVGWLKHNMHPLFGWGVPECRFSWGTVKDMLEDNHKKYGAVRVDWPDPKDDDDETEGAKLTDFFAAGKEDGDKADELANWFGEPVKVEAF